MKNNFYITHINNETYCNICNFQLSEYYTEYFSEYKCKKCNLKYVEIYDSTIGTNNITIEYKLNSNKFVFIQNNKELKLYCDDDIINVLFELESENVLTKNQLDYYYNKAINYINLL